MHALIQVPQPCTADWSTMTPAAGGRHCSQCCKTVIDFTSWKNEDILGYLKSHSGTCGRFRKDQLDTPIPIPAPEVFVQQLNRAFLPLARKAAALLLFVFCIMGASCNSSTPGQNLPATQQTAVLRGAGDTMAPVGPIVPGVPVVPVVPVDPDEHRLMGEPAIVPDSPTVEADPVDVLGGAPEVVVPMVPTGADSSVKPDRQ